MTSNNASALRQMKDGGIDEEDSENIEDLREQILSETSEMIEDRIKLLKFDLNKQFETMTQEQTAFFNKNRTRVDDI